MVLFVAILHLEVQDLVYGHLRLIADTGTYLYGVSQVLSILLSAIISYKHVKASNLAATKSDQDESGGDIELESPTKSNAGKQITSDSEAVQTEGTVWELLETRARGFELVSNHMLRAVVLVINCALISLGLGLTSFTVTKKIVFELLGHVRATVEEHSVFSLAADTRPAGFSLTDVVWSPINIFLWIFVVAVPYLKFIPLLATSLPSASKTEAKASVRYGLEWLQILNSWDMRIVFFPTLLIVPTISAVVTALSRGFTSIHVTMGAGIAVSVIAFVYEKIWLYCLEAELKVQKL